MSNDRRAALQEGALWAGALGLATGAMLTVRHVLDAAHIALLFVLIVLGASARGGRQLGMSMAVLAFVVFNFFFLPPYNTLAVSRPADWLILAAFLATSATGAHLLARFQSQAAAAEQRAGEIDRLASLGAEALNVARPEDAIVGIAEVIRHALGVRRTEIFMSRRAGDLEQIASAGHLEESASDARYLAGDQLRRWVAESGEVVVERAEAMARRLGPARTSAFMPADDPDARALILPLRVQARTVGILRVAHDAPLRLDESQQRFVLALAYYAALGLERVRLVGEALHAETLREADRMKDALLASVSHDLRTPLTTIKALAQDIRHDGDERAATIEQEADRLNRFVADLLDLSRLRAGAVPVKAELYAVDDLVGAALQRINAGAGGPSIRVRLEDPLLVARFDFTQALRALVNLLENAVKYSPREGVVELTASLNGDMVELSVADRGPGVREEDRAMLFQPFRRFADSGGSGVGLGLSIAQGLATAQGGSVDYLPRPGGGSVFRLRLAAPADAASL